MSGSVNKVILVGSLGRDPESRSLNNGERVWNFSLATSESWRDKETGDRKEKVEWHNITIFNEHIGKIVEQYCRKGSKIYLEGQLQTREYTDKDGNQRRVTEIIVGRFKGEITLLDGAKRGESTSEWDKPINTVTGRDVKPEYATRGKLTDIIDDDVPF